jgi:tetratricopeptide (TPR) repeat protein
MMETQPELFAQHYAEAGLVERSVTFWGNAGHSSAARSAMAEAAAQFHKGLDQLALLPDSRERQRQELEFFSALGSVLFIAKGQGSPEAGHAYFLAQKLWEELGSPSGLLQIPAGLARYHAFRGEFDSSLRLGEDLLRLSHQRNDVGGLISGHISCGRALLLSGRFASSRLHLEQVLTLSGRNSLLPPGAVTAHGLLGIGLLCLGYPDQALGPSDRVIAEGTELSHQSGVRLGCLVYGTMLRSLLGDYAVRDAWVDQLVAVATEQGLPHWRAEGTIYSGWVKVKNGYVAEGISLLRSGLTAYRAAGAEAWTTYHIALLVRACDIAGQIEESVTLLNDALQVVERTGERWCAAELNRHKGQLLLRQGHSKAPEELYLKALSIAREQEAKMWELRAAASLARLRRDQGRPAEARDLLAPLYGWFTEGFDTPDLKDAKALLDELGGG